MSNSKKPVCIVTEPDWLPDDVLAKIQGVFDVEVGPFTTDELIRVAQKAQGYFVGLDHVLSEVVLPENIEFVASPTTGLNHIDLDHARVQGIEVVSLKGETEFLSGITATSELCWSLILTLLRHVPQACASVEAGEWDRDRFIARELQGATIGIIGLGRLGKKIARYAQAFDMEVLACDPVRCDVDGVTWCELPELLERSDIVSLHADSKPENDSMIGAEELALMQEHALFVNTARGDLVDEGALLQALQDGVIAGAALDVLRMEHEADHAGSRALIDYAKSHDNLLITPHIGGVTHESQSKTAHFTVDKLLRWWSAKHG